MLVISGGGGAGMSSEDEVEEDSSLFVGEYAGDCGLLDRVVVGGSYIGGGEL